MFKIHLPKAPSSYCSKVFNQSSNKTLFRFSPINHRFRQMATQKYQDFSFAGNKYATYRPDYPPELFELVLSRLEGKRDLAVDVGAGTGQASVPLCKYFKKVVAVEPSKGLFDVAAKADNLEFREGTSDKLDFDDNSVDLVVAAQAAHWFDLEKFYTECRRVLRQKGLVALWGYGTCTIDDKIANEVLQNYYWKTLGGYWPKNRSHIDDFYIRIHPQPHQFATYERINTSMSKSMSLPSFVGYLETWSGRNEYMKANPELGDPLEPIKKQLLESYDNKEVSVSFPIFIVAAVKP